MIESLSELNPNKIYAYLQSEDLIYSLNKTNLIGRNNNCNIVLNHSSIENEHAKIEIIDNDIFLIDLNSVNGTYLNNTKIEGNKLVKLKNKDNIKFGNYENNYVLQLNIDNNLSIELQKNNINDNNNLISYFNNDPSINIKDNKISLVNDENYQYAKINHFNKNLNNNNNNNLHQNENNNKNKFNTFDINSSNEKINLNNNNNDYIKNNKNPIKEDFQIEENILNSNNNLQNNNKINSIIQEENSEDEISTIKDNNNNKNKNIENSQFNLLEQTHKKNKLLDKKLKEKIIEFQNLSNLYSQLNEKYNQLNSKHNSLMIYASELQNKNDFLTLNLKEKEIILKNFEDSDLNKVIIEKNILIEHLQDENEIYKNELITIKKGLLDNNDNNSNLSDNLNNLINDYLKQIIKYKQIINKYIAFETECTKKWNELIMANTHLKEKLESIDRKWNEDIKKFNDIIQNTDMRLNSALSQVPNNYGNFNIKKEEAAKFLVEQMNIYIQEKSNLLRENSELNKKLNLLSIENYQLKDEILKNELNNKNNDVNVLRNRIEELEDIIKQKDLINDPNKNLDYENIILKCNLEIKEKNILLEDFKNKIEEFKKNNNNYINFNDRDVINSMSKTLKEKDDLILNLKNQIINMNSQNNNNNNNNN